MFMIEIVNDPDRFMPEDIFDPMEESSGEDATKINLKKGKKKKGKKDKDVDKSELEMTVQGQDKDVTSSPEKQTV